MPNSILQCVCLLHSINLQAVITNAQDFEAAELEANHAQAVNLVINRSSELDSKLKQFSNSINQKLEGYLADNYAIYQPLQQCNNSANANHFQNQLCTLSSTNQQWQQEIAISSELHIYDTAATLLSTNILSTNLSTNDIDNLSATVTTYLLAVALSNLSAPTNSNTTTELTLRWNPKAKINPTKLEIIDNSSPTDPQFFYTSSRILTTEFRHWICPKPEFSELFKSPATITKNKLLNTIFLFKLEELSIMPLFSKAALEEKSIMAMYTDAKVDSHSIKLILDSELAGNIIIKQLMDQLDHATSTRIITANGITKTHIGEIDDFLIKVNGIMVLIKVLVIEATQYQALPEQPTHIHTSHMKRNLSEKSTKFFGLTLNTTSCCQYLPWETDNDQKEQINWKWKEDKKKKKKGKKKPTTNSNPTYNSYTTPHQSTYCRPKLVCINCSKKLSSMGTCCGNDKEYTLATKFYCYPCIIECFERPKRIGKWNNKLCLACRETLLDKGIGTCDELCQYTILITIKHLNRCPHDDNKIWQMTLAKIKGATPKKIKTIKNNPSESIELDWDPEPVINLLDPEQFHKHYQELALTRKEQKQHLEEINTQLCDHCLIPCDFQYCNECDFIYNPPPCMIYMIPEEKKPISNCATESESIFNPNSNFDNEDDENNGFSFTQNGNKNISDSDSNSNPKIYIALPDLSKEQELK
ncbi:hypothetical protein G9A89_022960 [Geosiphon pyriformis]|nr:hypothetical protein G9A89_022960 [Geosiphon pyriformis]